LVVPIVYDEDRRDVLQKLSKLNGVVFPGASGTEDYSKFG